MKERGMIFNAEMVRAILDGRKTQTRRIIKNQREGDSWRVKPTVEPRCSGHTHDWWLPTATRPYSALPRCPYGVVGDRIWVRETWSVVSHAFDDDGMMIDYVPDRPSKAVHEKRFGNGYYTGHAIYSADGEFTWGDDDGCVDGRSCWKPSIHMPRWASRITLEITAVRVERLQAISENDAIAEGGTPFFNIDWFSGLWASIYGFDSWQANPWVWVIEFKRVEGGAA